jgi:hypothetical protein
VGIISLGFNCCQAHSCRYCLVTMRATHKHTAFVWALSLLVRQATAAYWINQLDNYSSLPVCAEGPISTIVRGMVKGCGDGGRATSYSCFCTKSSSAFKDLIASSVEKACSGTGSEVVSATALFEEYCSLGIKQTSATTTGSDATTSSLLPLFAHCLGARRLTSCPSQR